MARDDRPTRRRADRATKRREYVCRKNESRYLLNYHDSSYIHYLEVMYRMLLKEMQDTCKETNEWQVNQHHLPIIQFTLEWLEITSSTQLKERLSCRWDVARQLKNKTYDPNERYVVLTEKEFYDLLNLMNRGYQFWQSCDKFFERMRENVYEGTYDDEGPRRKSDVVLYNLELAYKYYPLPQMKRQDFYKLYLWRDYVVWWSVIKHVDSFYRFNALQETRRDREIYNELFDRLKNTKTVKREELEIKERLVKIGHVLVDIFPDIQIMLNEEKQQVS